MDYRYVGTIRSGGLGGDDLVILELRPENCRMWQRMLRREQHQEAHVG
jgi:hypothetical protein